MNNKCRKCPSFGDWLWLIAGGLAAAACGLIYFATGFDTTSLTTFKIMTNHFQITAIYFSFKLNFPDMLLEAIRFLVGILSFDFVELAGLECSTGTLSYSERWTLAAFAPLMLMSPFAPIAVLEGFGEAANRRAFRTLTFLASFLFIWACSTCMEIWACDEVGDGTSYLNAAPEIECKAGNSVYDGLLAGSILFFLLYFCGIQGGLLWVASSDDEELKRGVVGEYREDCELWFCVINMHKWLVNMHPICGDWNIAF